MHDQNFKNLILDYPQQALAFFAAEEAPPDLEKARIVPIRQEQLKERLGDRFRELDTPLPVEWPDGRRAAILFVIEEETESSRFRIHRLAVYCLELAEFFQTDRVVPVVIFLNSGRRPAHLRLGSEHKSYLEFQYIACDLYQLPARRYYDSPNIVVRLNLPNMAYASEEKLDMYQAAQTGLVRLESDPEKQLKYIDFIDYYAKLSDEEVNHYRARFLDGKGEIMGLAQLLRDEGRQAGWREGRQEGRREERFNLLIRLLTRRFGILPQWARQRLQQAPPEQLEIWAEQLLDADSLETALDL